MRSISEPNENRSVFWCLTKTYSLLVLTLIEKHKFVQSPHLHKVMWNLELSHLRSSWFSPGERRYQDDTGQPPLRQYSGTGSLLFVDLFEVVYSAFLVKRYQQTFSKN